MESKKNFRDWKELPSELLRLISNKLSDLIYIARFRAVCKAWRCSASLADAPPQFPWRLEVTVPHHHSSVVLQEEFRFYALSSGETGTIRIRRFPRANYFTGPSCGSLLVHDPSNDVLSLINPLTNGGSSLPTFRGQIEPWPVWTGKDPMRNRNMIVVDRLLWRTGYRMLFFEGDMELLDVDCLSFCYLGRMLFMSIRGGVTVVLNALTRNELYRIAPPEDEDGPPRPQVYLIESAGAVFRVSRCGQYQEPTFRIYQLCFDQRKSNPSWVELGGIGDRMLFLDVNNGFSVPATSIAGCRVNCIYFFSSDRKPCVYDIEDGTVQWLWCPFERGTWHLPCLQYLYD